MNQTNEKIQSKSFRTKIPLQLQLQNAMKNFQNQELSTEDDLTTSLTESGRMRELQDKVPWLLIESLWDLIDLILMVYIGNIDQN